MGGIPEVVIHKKTGFLIEEEDPEVLAESIIKLYGDKKLREHLAGQGYQRFKENFLLEKFYGDYERQYRNLITTPKTSPV